MVEGANLKAPRLKFGALTSELTEVLLQWNLSKKHQVLRFLGPRLVGSIATPFTCIIDAIAHGVLFAGKMATLTFVASCNFIASRIDANYIAIKDLETSSTLKHIVKIIESLVHAAVLPFLMLLDPKEGYQRTHFKQQIEEKQRETFELKKQQIIAEQRVHLFDDFLTSLENRLKLPTLTHKEQKMGLRICAILEVMNQQVLEKKQNNIEEPDCAVSLIELAKQFQSMTEKEKDLELSEEQKKLLKSLKFDLSQFQQEPNVSKWITFLKEKNLTPERVYRESIALKLWCIFGDLSDKTTRSRHNNHLRLLSDWISKSQPAKDIIS